MKISENGKHFIMTHEGCKLTAYKPIKEEKYYTIGYGHYGADVTEGMKITKAQAVAMFEKDIIEYTNSVSRETIHLQINQNQFDALTSICYNCGAGALRKLVKGKTIKEISDAIPTFCINGANGKPLKGLLNRRKEEKELFDKVELFVYHGHVQKNGWELWANNGDIIGTTGKSLRLEAFEFNGTAKVRARAHVQKYGWLAEVGNGHICGTVGRSLRLEAFILECDTHKLKYRAHIGGGVGWTDWKTNGQICGTVGESKRIEAIQIEVLS